MPDSDHHAWRELLSPDAAALFTSGSTRGETLGNDMAEVATSFRRLADTVHDPIVILSSDEIVLDANETACRVYGFTRDQFIGMQMKTISVDVAAGEQQVERVMAGETVHFLSRQIAADGHVMDLDIHAVRIPYGDGYAILSVNRDVTAEHEYRNRDAAPVALFRATDDQLLTANRALVALLGYTNAAELTRKPMSAHFVEPVDVRMILNDIRAFGIARREVRLRRSDRSTIRVEVLARDAGKNVLEAFVTESTERHTVAAEMQLLLQSAYEGICTADEQGRCTLINAAAARMFGYEPDEMIGRCLHELTHHTRADGSRYPREECPLLRVPRTGQPWRGEELLWRSDGTSFPAEVAASPIIVDGHASGVVASFLDITDRKAKERQLETAERVAGLGRLAATVAHEFNNVLMAILPVIQVLERRLTDPKLGRLLETMKISVDRGKGITQEILRFTQQTEPIPQHIEVAPFLTTLRDELERMLAAPGVAIELDLPAERLWIAADPAQVQQVFVNLALNARDAMAGSGTLTICARRDNQRYVHFEVADTGPGMTEQVRKHAFDPLFTTKRSGTGLGLAVAYQVVKAHGGEIYVDSTPGHGARFHILLPRNGNSTATQTPEPDDANAAPWRVLLVEDDVAVSSGLATLMAMEGMHVEVVDHGSAVVEAIERMQPDVVVLDVGLPDMSGTSVYQALTSRWPELPVVFATGHADGQQIMDTVPQKNIVGYVQKPFSVDVLIGAIHRVMDGRETTGMKERLR